MGEVYDQPVRFGLLGTLGRMPEVAVVDLRGAEPELAWIHRGSSTFDRPDVEEVLGVLDDRRADEAGPT